MRGMIRFCLLSCIFGLSLLVFAEPYKIFASPHSINYLVAVLPGLGNQGSYGLALNNKGDVVGASSNPTNDQENIHAFFWNGDIIQDINAPDWVFSWPIQINNRDEATGWYNDANGANGGFVWRDGETQVINTTNPEDAVFAMSINERGNVVGGVTPAPGIGSRAFIWSNGALTYLDSPANSSTIAHYINNADEIAGEYGPVLGGPLCDAVVWVRGVFYNLGEFGGQCTDDIRAINNRGQILANAGGNAFLWQNGIVAQLPPLSDNIRSVAHSINDDGDVVGVSEGGYDCPCYPRPVIWHNGEPTDLSGFLPAQFQPVTPATLAINNRGQILITTGSKFNGTTFLLTPN